MAVSSFAVIGLAAAACGGGSATGSSGDGQAKNSAYCNQIRQVQQAQVAVQSNPNDLPNAFALFDKVAAVAPSQVEPSVQTLRGFYNRVLQALGSASPSDQTALDNAVNTALDGQQSQITSAAQKFNSYTKSSCGIDLSGGATGSGSTTSTTR
jgi:hypothetical protein